MRNRTAAEPFAMWGRIVRTSRAVASRFTARIRSGVPIWGDIPAV